MASPDLLIPFFCHVSLFWVHTNLSGSIIPILSYASGKPLLGISSLSLIRVSHSDTKSSGTLVKLCRTLLWAANKMQRKNCEEKLLSSSSTGGRNQASTAGEQLGGEKSSVDEKWRELEPVTFRRKKTELEKIVIIS